MTVTSIKRGLKKTGVLSKIENGLVTCQIEAKTTLTYDFFNKNVHAGLKRVVLQSCKVSLQ